MNDPERILLLNDDAFHYEHVALRKARHLDRTLAMFHRRRARGFFGIIVTKLTHVKKAYLTFPSFTQLLIKMHDALARICRAKEEMVRPIAFPCISRQFSECDG